MTLYQRSLDRIQGGIFGFAAAGILAQSCLGSVAAMLILQNGKSAGQMIELLLVVSVTMAFNGGVLSNQKPKILLNLLIISTIVNFTLAAINLLTFIY